MQNDKKGLLNTFLIPFSTYRHHCGMGAAAGCISGIGAIESGSIGDTFSGDASGCGGCGGCGG